MPPPLTYPILVFPAFATYSINEGPMKVGPFFDIFVTWKAKTLNNFIFYYMIAHIRLNGKDVPMNTIRKAMQLIENNEPEQAIVLLKRYTDKANEDELQIIAEIFIELGFLQDAENILKQLLKKYPKNSELKIMLSEIYVEWEQDELAISLLNEIDKNDPKLCFFLSTAGGFISGARAV